MYKKKIWLQFDLHIKHLYVWITDASLTKIERLPYVISKYQQTTFVTTMPFNIILHAVTAVFPLVFEELFIICSQIFLRL
jgi:hypothetical protein